MKKCEHGDNWRDCSICFPRGFNPTKKVDNPTKTFDGNKFVKDFIEKMKVKEELTKCPVCSASFSSSDEDFKHSCFAILRDKLALSEARLAALHELLGEINELFEKAKEILEGDDV